MTCVILLTLACGVVWGQETTGSIIGSVTDTTGAAIPGAKLELVGTTLPGTVSLTSDESGSFNAPRLPAGTYVVTATAQGFSTLKKTEINVILGRATRVDFRMEVGQVTESVVVSADSVLVDTTTSQSAINVDKTFFDQLPKGRSFYDLIAIAPGARNEGKAGGYQVDGASGSENTYYLDGMEVTNMQTGVLNKQSQIPVEMVQQVQVKNGVMDAEYGGAMGGVVNAAIRTGTNDYHGQAGFYFNNDSMQARPRPTIELDPADDTYSTIRSFQNKQDSFTTWNPVFDIGGPIIKNKLFFFTGYMPTKTSTDRTVTFVNEEPQVTGTYNQNDVQHFLVNKLNFAPMDKLRIDMSWIWNPRYRQGNLPARQGTSTFARDWEGLGDYNAGNTLSGKVDYLATSRLVFSFRGGYYYNNFTNRYAVSDTTFVYSSLNTMYPDLPNSLQRSQSGWVTQGSPRTDFDKYTRVLLSADGSYLGNFLGQHNLKFGYQTNRLSNSVNQLDYPTGYYRYYWNQAYTCVTTQCSGQQRGTYGYYRYYTYGAFGDASSDNQSFFLQDSWRIAKNLTLNLGIRAEREFLPSFSSEFTAAAPPIEFSWGDKISPRVGAAWDPTGTGKMRVYGSFGFFYDIMKYEMPRGSFGGNLYWTYYYALDDPNLMVTNQGYPADPTKLPGRYFEGINWRIPSNDPENSTVDPDLKPMKQQMIDIGYDYSFSPTLVGSARYTNRRLIRTIEDVGTLGPEGEIYYIGNPGYGLVADPATWEAGYPTTPKAKRHYDAVEIRLDKRFSNRYQFAASYTWSRTFGNYSGLASSDEPDTDGFGRTSPNVNRYFDSPWIYYTEGGYLAEGLLATDRPHTFKFFGNYTQKSKLGYTTISPIVQLYSGTPLTSQANAVSSTPIYPYGRGDLGRTPFFSNFDFNILHDFMPLKAHENVKVRFEFTVFNLFNTGTATNRNTDMLNANDTTLDFGDDQRVIFNGFNTRQMIADQFGGRINPLYNVDTNFQAPRSCRFQLSFFF